MFYRDATVKGLMDFIREMHSVSPWKDPKRFFKLLHRIVPFDNSAAFVKVDPETSRILPSGMTLWDDDADVLKDHNDYFWRFKQPIVAQIVKNQFRTFHVQNTLSQFLPGPESEEYRIDFWEKHRKRFSFAQYFKTREGLFSLYLTRSSHSPDFSEEEQGLLQLLIPHMEQILSSADPEIPNLFADATGKIVSIEDKSDDSLNKHPLLLNQFQLGLPTWIDWFLEDPFKPLKVEIKEKKQLYRCQLSPAGSGKNPLYRLSWQKGGKSTAMSPKVLRHFCQQHSLSPRETEVVGLAVAGQQRKEMAVSLGLSVETIKEYLSAIYRKTEVEGKGELVAKVLSGMQSEQK